MEPNADIFLQDSLGRWTGRVSVIPRYGEVSLESLVGRGGGGLFCYRAWTAGDLRRWRSHAGGLAPGTGVRDAPRLAPWGSAGADSVVWCRKKPSCPPCRALYLRVTPKLLL